LPAAGFVEDVQQQKPGAASFSSLVTGSTAQSKAITLTRGTWNPGAVPQGRDRQGQRLLAAATVKIS
jgi:hypothetical protein